MVDRYLPALDAFELDVDEQAAVGAGLATDDPWGWEPGGAQQTTIVAVKGRIRDYHMARHQKRCCYCRVNLHGGGHFMIDREHILPKSKLAYRLLSYTMWNLGIACKRCNMEYKGNKIDFVVTPDEATLFQASENYRFIHPNFDLYSEHLARTAVEANDTVIVKYTILPDSEKGAYTYQYFNLRGLEIGSFDEAQGAPQTENLGDLALEAQALADQFGQ